MLLPAFFSCLGNYKIPSCGYICLKERHPAPAPRHSRHKPSGLRKGRPPSFGRFAYDASVHQGALSLCSFSGQIKKSGEAETGKARFWKLKVFSVFL